MVPTSAGALRGKGVYHGSTQKVLPLQTIMLLPQMPERKRGKEKMINREREEWGRKRRRRRRRRSLLPLVNGEANTTSCRVVSAPTKP